ncbi:MAG TPA: biosynthetic arginine decarboxylase [Opitutaceae bacterium]
MKTRKTTTWSPDKSVELYGFGRWGGGHFSVDGRGFVQVHPLGDERAIRILDVIEEAKGKGLKAPFTVRFQDLLHKRVHRLNEVFATAISEEGYSGTYRGVFPIKVNQLREVVEEILDAGREHKYGLEAGSKPELMIALALHEDNNRLIICNGYKDDDYIRMALLGRRLGKKVIIVVEQFGELETILRIAGEMNVEPMIGLRAKLNARGEGKWAMSTGDNAKFGLTTAEILAACTKLQETNMQDCLHLLHFHIGSQVPNIITIKNAVIEASRYYCQLVKLGFPMGYIDVGGGLGIDYDGSRTNFESSMNYSIDEYARDVVFNIKDICQGMGVSVPDIVSESGRAVTAFHSVLVVEVFERISKEEAQVANFPEGPRHKLVEDMQALLQSKDNYGRLERFHDAIQKKEEASTLFNLGFLDLQGRAQADSLFWQICRDIDAAAPAQGYQPEELLELKKLLADQYVCNFSVFQSLLDHWALKQLFPVAPIHRLHEKPSVNATLVDITCDSDGKINQFIDLQDVRDYLPLHPLNGKPYYLGIFLVGAYQDIMGDLHNLFGRVNEVHVFLDEDEEDGFYIEDTINGSRISEVLAGVQYDAEDLCRRLKRQIDAAIRKDLVKPREGIGLLELYEGIVQDRTYLRVGHEKKVARTVTRKRAKK